MVKNSVQFRKMQLKWAKFIKKSTKNYPFFRPRKHLIRFEIYFTSSLSLIHSASLSPSNCMCMCEKLNGALSRTHIRYPYSSHIPLKTTKSTEHLCVCGVALVIWSDFVVSFNSSALSLSLTLPLSLSLSLRETLNSVSHAYIWMEGDRFVCVRYMDCKNTFFFFFSLFVSRSK